MINPSFIASRVVAGRPARQLRFIDSVLELHPDHVPGDLRALAQTLQAAGLKLNTTARDPEDWTVDGYVSLSLQPPWPEQAEPAVKHAKETGDWSLYDAITTAAQKREDAEIKATPKQEPVQPKNESKARGYLSKVEELKARMKKS